MSERTDDKEILSEEPAIVGHDSAKYMFTDITYGVHDRDRLIVSRDPCGTLRQASWNERDRLNQIYFPRKGRRIKAPVLFDLDVLSEVSTLRCQKFCEKGTFFMSLTLIEPIFKNFLIKWGFVENSET